MHLHFIENPSPIKLSQNEQNLVKEILDKLESLMFGKWSKQKGAIGNTKIFEKMVPIKRYGKDKIQDIKIIVRGSKKKYNRYRPLFGFTSGNFMIWRSPITGVTVKTHLEVHLNGWAKKNTFAQVKRDSPFQFWKSYLGFKSTIRHELIHAKDPEKFEKDRYGTSAVSSRYGFVGYINDPARIEFRAHLGEWDILTNELQDVVKNRNKNDYYRGIWNVLKQWFCTILSGTPKNRNRDFISELESPNRPRDSPIPKSLAERLTLNKEFHDFPLSKMNSMIDFLEQAYKPRWKAYYEDKVQKYLIDSLNRKIKRKELSKEISDEGKVSSPSKYTTRAKLMNEVKKRMKKFFPKPLPKKPKLKTNFTKKERQNILDYRQNNYPDMVSAIYSLFKKKGLLNPSLCDISFGAEVQSKKKDIEDRRKLIFTVLQKSVIRSLSVRFESLEKMNNE